MQPSLTQKSLHKIFYVFPLGLVIPKAICILENMLSWILTFLVIALIAGVLGFTGIAGAATEIAKILFFVFLVLLILSALVGALRGRPPV